MRIALLFPGQGAQTPGFLHRLPDQPVVHDTLEEAQGVLTRQLADLDTPAALESTVAVQLCTLVAGVAGARALEAAGLIPDAVAGLSVGAFAAAVTAKVVSFAHALQLVRLRGELMERAFPTGYGMAAISGLSEQRASALIAHQAEGQALFLANINGPTDIVVSGEDAALTRMMDRAQATGARARRLCVRVPSHCPLMTSVSAGLREAMQNIPLGRPRVGYVSNQRARISYASAAVKEDLIANVSHTVRWHDSVSLLNELGCRLYVEPSPGSVLSNLVKSTFPRSRAVSLDEVSIADATLLAQRAGAE
jgi:malonate decarboxylase epsilon subunit